MRRHRASGGGAVIESLLKKQQWNVVALSRNPEGATATTLKDKGVTLKKADLRDRSSLRNAFEGAHFVYGVTQPFSADYKKSDPKGEVEQGRNIIDSCIETGISHLVLSTVFGIDKQSTSVSHVDSKTIIADHLHTLMNTRLLFENLKRCFRKYLLWKNISFPGDMM